MGTFIKSALFLSFVSVASAAVLPFAFTQNHGQADAEILYTGTGPEFKAWFRHDGVILQQKDATVRVTFGHANANPAISSANPTGAVANYIHGNDPSQWKTGLPLYGAIHYSSVWPGIEVDYKALNGRVKAEYVVNKGANPAQIELNFDGKTSIEADGTLRIHTANGDFIEDKPVLFQGDHHEISGSFVRHEDGSIGFEVGQYDETKPLIIDPAILFSGYFGGGSQDAITSIALDSYGDTIAAGWTSSTNLPASAGAKKANDGGVDAFVAAFSPNGGSLMWCTYLGGSGDDRAFGVTVDSARNVYVTGWASSTNFPVTTGAYQKSLGGTRDAFVTKLTPTGNAIVFSTFLGGSAVDAGNAIALDTANNIVIAGDTTSTNLSVSARAAQLKSGGTQDAFVAKLSTNGNMLLFMTYLGGAGADHAATLKLDGSNNVFVGGETASANFPTALAYQARSGGGIDAFLTKLSADGTTLDFSTYLGGAGGSTGLPEEINGLCIDLLGNVVVAGTTSSPNFPVTTGAFQTRMAGTMDGFVTRFSNAGALLNSTYLGGSLSDQINAIALDYHGDVYLTGSAVSSDFPTLHGLQIANNGTGNAFAAKLNPTLTTLIFSTYIGGSAYDVGNTIAVDAETTVTVAGQTSSFDFPVLGNMTSMMPSSLTSFVTRLKPNFTVGIDYEATVVTDPWHVSWYTAVSSFGSATDRPVSGDWDGTGKKRIGVFSNGVWYLDINGDGYFGTGDKTVTFGQAGDIPVVGDWTGSGHISLGLFRNGTFILDLSGHLSGVATGQADATYTAFGQAGDIPVAADWNNSGTTKVGVFRAGKWLVDYNGDGVFNASDKTYTYGQAGDLPIIGDWDSSGHCNKIGIYRSGLWVLDYDGDNAWTVPVLNETVLAFGGNNFNPLIF